MRNKVIKLVFPLLAVLLLVPGLTVSNNDSNTLIEQKTAEGYVADARTSSNCS